jgi:hypothetical protein
MVVVEVSGLVASPVDNVDSTGGINAGATTWSTGNLTTTHANDILFAAPYNFTNTNSANACSGCSATASDTTSGDWFGGFYKVINTTISGTNLTGTANGGTVIWTGLAIAYKGN